MIAIVLKPGEATLADWRRSIVAPCRSSMRAVVHSSSGVPRRSRASWAKASRCMASIPASASSASVRIDTTDLARLQRNIVLSHAAGVGEPLPVNITRLMMALKL